MSRITAAARGRRHAAARNRERALTDRQCGGSPAASVTDSLPGPFSSGQETQELLASTLEHVLHTFGAPAIAR